MSDYSCLSPRSVEFESNGMRPCMCRDWSENRDGGAPPFCANVGTSSNSFYQEMASLPLKMLSENAIEPKRKVLEVRDVSVQVSFDRENNRSTISEVAGKSDLLLDEEKPLPSSSFFTASFPAEKRIQTLPSIRLSRNISSCFNSGISSQSNSAFACSSKKNSVPHFHREDWKSSSAPFPRASSCPLHESHIQPHRISHQRFEAPAASASSFNHSSGAPAFRRRDLSVPHFIQTPRVSPYGLQSRDPVSARTPLSNTGRISHSSSSMANTWYHLAPPPRGNVRPSSSRRPTEAPPLSSSQYSSPSSIVVQRAPSTRRTAMRRSPSASTDRRVHSAHCRKPSPAQLQQEAPTVSPPLLTTSRAPSRRSSSRRHILKKEVFLDSDAILIRNVSSSPTLSVWSTSLNSTTALGRICRLNVLPILAARETQKQADASRLLSTLDTPPQHVERKKVEDDVVQKSKEKVDGKRRNSSEPHRASRKVRKYKKARTTEKKKRKVEKRKRIRTCGWQKWVKWFRKWWRSQWWWQLFASSSSHSSANAEKHHFSRSKSRGSRSRNHLAGSANNGTICPATIPDNKSKVGNQKWPTEASLRASEHSTYTRSDPQKKKSLSKSLQNRDVPCACFFQKLFRMKGIVGALLFLIFLIFFPLLFHLFFSSAPTSSTVNTRVVSPPSYFSSSSVPIPPSFV